MKASEIMPLHIAYAPMEQMDELNKALNILAKLYVRWDVVNMSSLSQLKLCLWVQMQLNWLLQYLILRANILADKLMQSHS